MAKVITRYFESAARAGLVRHELIRRRRFSPAIVDLYDEPKGLAKTLAEADVEGETAKAYEKRMKDGGAVLLVRAGHKPLAVAQTTREVMAAMGAADMGGAVEEVFVADPPPSRISVLTDHPRFLTRPRDPSSTTYHMADWPIPLLSRRKPFAEMAIPRHARMADWPVPLINRGKPYSDMLFPRHARMAAFPIPLISRRRPFARSAFPRHARMAAFPIPLLSRRKPFSRSLFPRHRRMANWPFPLLINGKTGQNALIPGAPRMADFPIPLLSRRKPYDKTSIPRHGRMANFPIPLLSGRKPFTASAFPRHARMADFILPLVIRRRDGKREAGGGWTLSKALGVPTLLAR